MENKKKQNREDVDLRLNKQFQGVDMDPAKEAGKGEKVTNRDLKGKKVDADPAKKKNRPV